MTIWSIIEIKLIILPSLIFITSCIVESDLNQNIDSDNESITLRASYTLLSEKGGKNLSPVRPIRSTDIGLNLNSLSILKKINFSY